VNYVSHCNLFTKALPCLIFRIASESFKKACGGKDPEHLQAPSAHELAWSHALTLARDAEAEHLLCRYDVGVCGLCMSCVIFHIGSSLIFMHSDKRHGNKASFGSLCEAYLSAFALILALWLDPACSISDKNVLEKYMSKVDASTNCDLFSSI
jgi:hypothetical protein